MREMTVVEGVSEVEPFAREINEREAELVEELKKQVAHVVDKYPPHQLFCTYGTYVRYLRARSWNIHKATKMLLGTLQWREEYKPENITWETVEGEAKLGKVFILENSDNEGRPVVFMRPRNEVPGGDNDVKLKWVVYIMEHASRIADASSPDGKMAWLLDYEGYNRQNQPPWKVSLSTLSIVQNHYPERLGKAVNFKPPLLFQIFWKAIRPFVDPVTREKLVFLDGKDIQLSTTEMAKYFDLNHLDEVICGQLPEGDMYDYESFYKRMDAADKTFTAKLENIGSS